jgi:hypothetical protein
VDALYGEFGDDEPKGSDGADYLDGGFGLDECSGGTGFDLYHDGFDLSQPYGDHPMEIYDVHQRDSEICQSLTALVTAVHSGFDLADRIEYLGGHKFRITTHDNHSRVVEFDGTWSDWDPFPDYNDAGQVVNQFWTIPFIRARFAEYEIDWASPSVAQFDKYRTFFHTMKAVPFFTGIHWDAGCSSRRAATC